MERCLEGINLSLFDDARLTVLRGIEAFTAVLDDGMKGNVIDRLFVYLL